MTNTEHQAKVFWPGYETMRIKKGLDWTEKWLLEGWGGDITPDVLARMDEVWVGHEADGAYEELG